MRVTAVSGSEAFNLFLNSLGACFSEQLTSYRSIVLAPPVVQGTSQLTRLEMDWHKKALEFSILPHAESLQRLVLDNLPFELNWRRVCGGNSAPPRIVFPSLKYLRISYDDDLHEPLMVHGERVEADHTVVLDLPVLAILDAKRCPSSCAVMFNSVLPPRMEAMKLFCSKSALHAISERVLPVCQRLHVHVMNIEPHLGPIAVESLDGALAKLKAEAGVSVDMVALREPVLASGPYWNTVGCLSIDETNLDNMVQLLAALPYLRKFRVLFLYPGGETLDAYAAKNKALMACMQELSSSKLKELYIALGVNMLRRPEVVGMIREVAARIPGLQRLEVVELAD
ncbi:hypothetical protein H4R19_004914 [Coemansia spiralis]|nr:hypothetical protein H4R19_004914 [Coemansia spiralis]